MSTAERIDPPTLSAERRLPSRRAKIVCTIGPASRSESMIRELLRLGMDVARLNFSHSTHEEHARVIERLRRTAEKEGRTLAILQDLQGPKIRTGRLKFRTPVRLKPGSRLIITPRDVPGTSSLISTSYPRLAPEVAVGARILLCDGLIELRVRAIHGEDIECEVVNGGMLGEHQGINLPGTEVQVPALTEKDEKDLRFGLKHGVDLVAVSFVRRGEDVLAAKRFISEAGSQTPVIAKLEKPQAIDRLEEILEVADGVMVARGDLGVEVAPEKVPVIQKHIIQRASEWRKPVITATQMLESMIENPRPTRAEASDVANAVFDGTDAVMLSAETASGQYPREAVTMMGRIVAEAESDHSMDELRLRWRNARRLSIAETICESVAHAAHDLEMRAIAVFTETGTTARLISKYRPAAPIYAFTAFPQVANRLNLLWGVSPIVEQAARTGDDMVRAAERELLRRHAVTGGDVMGVVAGTQMASGSTNFMRLHVVGSRPQELGAAARAADQAAAGAETEITMSENSEIVALAVVEAFDGKDEECLQLLHEFYAVLRRKQLSRDLLYRDLQDPRRFINIRYWHSAETRAEAHEDPDVHKFWKRLSEISRVTSVFERLEDVTPEDSMAKQQG